jgi:isochorismate synthase/2-succinyl-5-enolpyruvyl-6-hydroxy-3-cyclohexene-1-carboxylate synthase/2-succinyl-6-hydroxy-2,4-cyclohexadiene-1-carboxylate synthase/O-succinylbenzoate synthase
VFLHGFLGTGGDWRSIMESLSLTCRCISVDLPGHGETVVEEADDGKLNYLDSRAAAPEFISSTGQTQGAWSFEGLALALTQLLKKLDSERVILVGYSMGARIAMYMASRHSEQVNSLVS